MNESSSSRPPGKKIEHEASAWVLRWDRGLSPAEQDAFSQWLAADPSHGAQFARLRRHWNRMAQLVHWAPEHSAHPNPDLLAPRLRQRLRRLIPITLAAAAAIIVVGAAIVLWPRTAHPDQDKVATATPERERVLSDGSMIDLNQDALIAIDFTPTVRRVRLDRGEAHFTVTKDRARPFVVAARGIEVRAVGTAFNVRLDAAAVEVLVTEGDVELDAAAEAPARAATPSIPVPRPVLPRLSARQRAVVSLAPDAAPPQVATLTSVEIDRVLAWQHRLLTFSSAPLSAIVAEFNRRNRVQLVVLDPELAKLRLSVTFRSDNIDGFVHLLEAGFGVEAERGPGQIGLRLAPH